MMMNIRKELSMQIVIDIDEKVYNEYMNLATGRIPTYKACDIAWVLKNGTILPKGHGRLIDVDALKPKFCNSNIYLKYGEKGFWYYSVKDVNDTPTIIKADK